MLHRDPAEGHRGADRGTGARVRLPHHGRGHVPRRVQARDRGAVRAQYAGVGIGCVATPVIGAGDRSPLAAISLSGPADTMELPRLAATLRHTAATLRRGAPTLAEGVGQR